MKKFIVPMALVLTLGSLAAIAVHAQQYPPQQNQYPQNEDPADAAEHSAARVSLVNGNVSIARGDTGEPASGSLLNAPLVTSDRIATSDGARAEVELDGANLLRLAPNTEVRMGDLQYHRYLVQVLRGTATFRVLRDTDAKVEISTPSVSVAPLRQGTYRVSVHPDGSSEITLRAGEADLFSPSGSERMAVGQTILSRGPATNPEFMTVAAIPFDDWDRWNADRDRAFDHSNDVSRYTGPDVSGAEDLSNFGRWVSDPAYGEVWTPNNVSADWAPYRDGRWDYVDYYGWSWVSDDPWGWAPYHYGNWYRANFGWAWYPGAIGSRHYWRPAMVGFFGFGSPGFGSSLGFGYSHVGWVPLAPRETFRPWYGRGYSGGRSVNVVSNTNIGNVYLNARYNNSVTGLRAGDFGRSGVGRSNFVRPAATDLSRAGMVNGGMPFAPSRGTGTRAFNGGGLNNNGGGFNNRSQPSFNNRPANVVPLGGQGNPGWVNHGENRGDNRGGWRRLDSQPGGNAAVAPPAAPKSGNEGSRSFGGSPREQQPVRISPPIVNNRTDAPSNFGANQNTNPNTGTRGNAPRNEFGGFGGPRPNNGGGFNAPPAPRAAPAPHAAPPNGGGGGGGFSGTRGNGGGNPGGGGGGNRGGGNGGGGGNRGGGNNGGHGGGHGR